MYVPRKIATLSALAAATLLTACGGGGGGSDPAVDNTSPVLSSGIITRFGSVYVNGVRYHTSNARIVSSDDGSTIIDRPSDDQLRQYLGLGQVVTVLGSSSDDGSNGAATVVVVDDDLVGKVESVNAAQGTFVVLGQTVTVTPDTIIDDSMIESAGGSVADDVRFADVPVGITLDQLVSVDMLVEVAGFSNGTGIQATRVEDVNTRTRRDDNDDSNNPDVTGEVEVKGTVSGLTASSFMINSLTVNYDAGDLDPEDFSSAADLQNGMFVEVKGTSPSAGVLNAQRIQREDDIFDDSRAANRSGDDSGRIEIEGVLTGVVQDASGSGGVVTIGDTEVRVDDVTPFLGSIGLRIEIKGSLTGDTLILSRFKDESEDTIRIEDSTVGADDGDTVTTRLGLVVQVSDRTRTEREGSGRIEARGFELNGAVVWTRMEIESDDDSDCRLRGPVESVTGTSATDFGMVIQGISIDVDNITSFNSFQNSADIGIGRQAFYDQLTAAIANGESPVVQAQSQRTAGACSSGLLTAREVEFENLNSFSDDNNPNPSGSDDGPGDDNGGDDNGVDDNPGAGGVEVIRTVESVSAGSFVAGGQTITVSDDTIIDDSIIEAARGVEIQGDRTLGSIPESLTDLLSNGDVVKVVLSGSQAVKIEDL